MPKGSQLSVSLYTTDAEFQVWVNAMHAVIAASGMVQTSDSGQITIPYTGVKPNAVNVVAGYEIWRMADAQQANYPVFIKLEYGSSASDAGSIGMYVTIGTGSNGSGTITGILLARTKLARNGTATAGTLENVATHGPGYFCFATGLGSNFTTYFALQRHLDASGNPTDNAIFVFFSSQANTVWATLMKQPGGLLINRSSSESSGVGPPVLFCPDNTNLREVISLNGEVPLYPFEPFLGRRQSPLLGACVVHDRDVGAGVVFTATMYGATKTWRRVSESGNAYTRGTNTSNGGLAALALRWET